MENPHVAWEPALLKQRSMFKYVYLRPILGEMVEVVGANLEDTELGDALGFDQRRWGSMVI